MLKDLITKNRSFRRFCQDSSIDRQTLEELIELARLSASSANLQPLKYILSCQPQKNALIFPHLAWAGYLTDWTGPADDERPTAYIIIIGDKNITANFHCDHGIAAQSILLGAAEKNLGGCIVGSIQRDKLRQALNIPPNLDILLVLALGKPKETVVLETAGDDSDIKYYRDKKDIHHVPKRPLKDIIID